MYAKDLSRCRFSLTSSLAATTLSPLVHDNDKCVDDGEDDKYGGGGFEFDDNDDEFDDDDEFECDDDDDDDECDGGGHSGKHQWRCAQPVTDRIRLGKWVGFQTQGIRETGSGRVFTKIQKKTRPDFSPSG